MHVIEHVLSRVDRLVIGVGSSSKSNQLENPFSFEERKRIIEQSLVDHVDRFSVHPIPDFGDDKKWVKYIKENLPHFDTVYTNAGRETSLFSSNRFIVEEIPFFERKEYSATEVRKRMLSGGDWRKLLPKEAADVIDEINGLEQIRKLQDQ